MAQPLPFTPHSGLWSVAGPGQAGGRLWERALLVRGRWLGPVAIGKQPRPVDEGVRGSFLGPKGLGGPAIREGILGFLSSRVL